MNTVGGPIITECKDLAVTSVVFSSLLGMIPSVPPGTFQTSIAVCPVLDVPDWFGFVLEVRT